MHVGYIYYRIIEVLPHWDITYLMLHKNRLKLVLIITFYFQVYSLAFIGLTSAGFGYHDYGLHSTILDPIPLYKPAPILEPAPVIPIVKHIIPPATSYATITQVHVTHPQPIVKVIS